MTAVTVYHNDDVSLKDRDSGVEMAMQNDRRMEVRGHRWNGL